VRTNTTLRALVFALFWEGRSHFLLQNMLRLFHHVSLCYFLKAHLIISLVRLRESLSDYNALMSELQPLCNHSDV
jgi:hypothetical protein